MDSQVLALRRNCITGTDIAGILGLSKWSSPLKVYLDKKGLLEDIDNRYMEWGRRLEPLVAAKYAEDNSVELTPGAFIQKGIFGGTPDFLTPDKLIEIKTTSFSNRSQWGEQGTDQIPPVYITQVQWYMGLVDREVCDTCVLIGGNEYGVYVVKRNEKLIEILRQKATEFWEKHVLKGEPPHANSGIDSKLISSMCSSHSDVIVDRPVLSELAKKLAESKDELRRISDEIDALEANFKQTIGENLGVRGQQWSATWKKVSDRKIVDWESIARLSNPDKDTINKHTKVSEGYRRFVFKSNF
jgi:putative phage-type endonuclease